MQFNESQADNQEFMECIYATKTSGLIFAQCIPLYFELSPNLDYLLFGNQLWQVSKNKIIENFADKRCYVEPCFTINSEYLIQIRQDCFKKYYINIYSLLQKQQILYTLIKCPIDISLNKLNYNEFILRDWESSQVYNITENYKIVKADYNLPTFWELQYLFMGSNILRSCGQYYFSEYQKQVIYCIDHNWFRICKLKKTLKYRIFKNSIHTIKDSVIKDVYLITNENNIYVTTGSKLIYKIDKQDKNFRESKLVQRNGKDIYLQMTEEHKCLQESKTNHHCLYIQQILPTFKLQPPRIFFRSDFTAPISKIQSTPYIICMDKSGQILIIRW